MSIALTMVQDRRQTYLRLIPALFQPLLITPLRNPRVWIGLGWSDIVQSYRRTMLGPLWITLNLAIFATAMTVVYSALFGVPPAEYSGFVVSGMIAWMWIAALLSEVGNTFINYSSFIKSMPVDKSIFIWATVWKQLITLAHHIVVYGALIAFGVIHLSAYTLLTIPAVAVLFVFSLPFTAITAVLFSRYRDVSRLINGSIIILLMITPIFWQPGMITGWRSAFIYLNPVYYLVEFLRRPLLGEPLDLKIVLVVLGMTVAVWIIGAVVYRRYSRYVVFWI